MNGYKSAVQQQYGAVDKSKADWPVFDSQLYYLPAMLFS